MICKENRLKTCWDLSHLNLEELDLQKNQISNKEEMQKTIKSLLRIKKLNIRDNCFAEEEKLNSQIIETCNSLEELNGKSLIEYKNTSESKKKIIFNIRGYT